MPRRPNTLDPRAVYQRGRIQAAIADGPLTARQLADKLHLTKDAINLHLKAMKEASPQQIYIAGHDHSPNGGRPAPMYSPGEGNDAVYVKMRAAEKLQGRKELVQKTLQLAADALMRNPMTAFELGDVLDLTPSRTRWYLNELHRSGAKRIYIKRYQTTRTGYPAPVYAIGDKRDATYKAKTRRQVYVEAMKDPERRKRIQNRLHLRNLIESKRKKPNGIFGALGI